MSSRCTEAKSRRSRWAAIALRTFRVNAGYKTHWSSRCPDEISRLCISEQSLRSRVSSRFFHFIERVFSCLYRKLCPGTSNERTIQCILLSICFFFLVRWNKCNTVRWSCRRKEKVSSSTEMMGGCFATKRSSGNRAEVHTYIYITDQKNKATRTHSNCFYFFAQNNGVETSKYRMEKKEEKKLSCPMWSDSLSNLYFAYTCWFIGDDFGRLVADSASSSGIIQGDDSVDLQSDVVNGHDAPVNTIRTEREPSFSSSCPDEVDPKWFVADCLTRNFTLACSLIDDHITIPISLSNYHASRNDQSWTSINFDDEMWAFPSG